MAVGIITFNKKELIMKNLIYLTVGIGIGAFGANWYLSKKYNTLLEEEIEALLKSVNESEEEEVSDINDYPEVAADYEDLKADKESYEYEKTQEVKDYNSISKDNGYIPTESPYTISEEDFGAIESYAQVEVFYYTDGFITDEFLHILDLGETELGVGTLDTFGEYDEELVHIQNDTNGTYYRVELVNREYNEVSTQSIKRSNVFTDKPHLVGREDDDND